MDLGEYLSSVSIEVVAAAILLALGAIWKKSRRIAGGALAAIFRWAGHVLAAAAGGAWAGGRWAARGVGRALLAVGSSLRSLVEAAIRNRRACLPEPENGDYIYSQDTTTEKADMPRRREINIDHEGPWPDGVTLDIDGGDGERLAALVAEAAASAEHGRAGLTPSVVKTAFEAATQEARSRIGSLADHAALRNAGGSLTDYTRRAIAAAVLYATGMTGEDLMTVTDRIWESWFNGKHLSAREHAGRGSRGSTHPLLAGYHGRLDDHEEARAVIRNELNNAPASPAR